MRSLEWALEKGPLGRDQDTHAEWRLCEDDGGVQGRERVRGRWQL